LTKILKNDTIDIGYFPKRQNEEKRMKNTLIPLTIGDIEFGKEYLLVEMWLNNIRYLRPLVIIEEISVSEANRCVLVCKNGTSDEHPHSFSDFGLISGKRDNKWRVFENTPANRRALEKLVANPSALDYLLAIGFAEREALEVIRKNTSDLEKKRESER
jgi:hypothetical protein